MSVLFADWSPADYVLVSTAVVAALGVVVTNVVTLILTYKAKRDQAERDAAIAKRVELVRADTLDAAAKVENAITTVIDRQEASAAIREQKLDIVAGKVEEVHRATNSLTDRLVESSNKEGYERGVREQREKKDMP